MKLVDGVLLVAVGVVGVILAFWILGTIAGLIWGFVKIAVIVAVIIGVLFLLMGRRRRSA
ncbi:MAG: lmo0937 family membrane protein [Acidimicrobiales bacterium]